MPLFGFRKDKKHEKDHIQATASMAKSTLNKSSTPKKELIKEAKITNKSSKIAKEVSLSPTPIQTSTSVVTGIFSNITDVILRPRITEKSGLMSQDGVYSFEVSKNANKKDISRAINLLYKVHATKVAVINTPSRKVFVRGKRGVVAGIRKAVVTIKKGEKIDFI